MSEFINNREYRQNELKKLIMKLHGGASVEDVREEFATKFGNVAATEIAAMENSLIQEGMPLENIQLLCDVHAAVFKGSVEQIHANDSKDGGTADDNDKGDHPVDVLKKENRLIETMISEKVLPALEDFMNSRTEGDYGTAHTLADAVAELSTIDKHYARKEYLIFPVMERNDITAPPQVMWGVDDEIRGKLKGVLAMLKEPASDVAAVKEATEEVTTQIIEMIFKEEEIMLPMIADVFTDKDWESVSESSGEFGFMFEEPVKVWKSGAVYEESAHGAADESTVAGYMNDGKRVSFDAGSLLPEEINAILNTVPVDMTFVGADDRVKYFTQGKDRIFDRPKTIIGREVKHCHPPKSVHVVEQIVEDLRSGRKDHEDFWINMGGKFVHIRYFAVRGKSGEFLGTLEVSQDIKPLRDLEGEKRLMS
ncbi:MAG: DUF438 domain-containing protein [Eubacteriales bacterium]|nr:DUF438 domain-containing protein [Eubacteriales bacterium]